MPDEGDIRLLASRSENSTFQTFLAVRDFIVAHYEDYSIWLTTFGRKTCKPRLVQIWFAFVNDHFYVFSRGGLGSQWAKNALKNDRVIVNLAGRALPGTARLLEDNDMRDEIYKYYRAKYRLYPQAYIFSWKKRTLFEIELDGLVAGRIQGQPKSSHDSLRTP